MEKALAELNRGRNEVQAAPELQPIALRSMFWRPNWLEASGWMEHIPFGFWLVEAHRPKVIVELGTHRGTSYFAFCQAVERLGLDSRCFAVDSWKGDDHAGFYGEEVFEMVSAHNNAHYSGFSRLVRSSFDAASHHFSAGSIDLLHIDGLHTLEAVLADFDTWAPKLSDRAIVLLHDTNVRERGFGVYQLFERLRGQHPNFEFVHGNGLGVLGVGNQQNQMLQQLFGASARDEAQWAIRDVFSRLGRSCADAYAAGRQAAQVRVLTQEIDQHKKQLEQISATLELTRTQLERQADELARSREKLSVQVEEHAVERGQLAERVTLLQEVRVELKEQLGYVQAQLERAQTNVSSISPLQERGLSSSTQADVGVDAAGTEPAADVQQVVEELENQLREARQELEVAKAEFATGSAAAAEALQAESEAIQLYLHRQIEALNEQLSSSTDLVAQIQEKHRMELDAALEAKRSAEASVRARFGETALLGRKLIDLQEQLAAKTASIEQQQVDRERLESELESKLELAQSGRQQAEKAAQDAESRLDEILQSKSWRATAFLRSFRGGSRAAKPAPQAALPAPDAMTEEQERDAQVIRNSGLFDSNWYLQRYADVAQSGTEPVRHYVENGARELRDPGPGFSTRAYVKAYPDVLVAGHNPLVHYLKFGRAEGRTVERSI